MNKLILIMGISIGFYSCDEGHAYQAPVLNSTKPFIVKQINNIGNGMAEYYGCAEAGYSHNGCVYDPLIILPIKLYNIGDTIRIK